MVKSMFKNCNHSTKIPPFPEAARRIWAAHWLLVCRRGWEVESENAELLWQCWQERGWWREQTGWRPGPVLWRQRKPLGPPDKPLDTVPAGTGRWTDSPEPYSSFSSSLLEYEELEETQSEYRLNSPFNPSVKTEIRLAWVFLHFSFCWNCGVYGEKSTHSTMTWRMLATACNVEGTCRDQTASICQTRVV